MLQITEVNLSAFAYRLFHDFMIKDIFFHGRGSNLLPPLPLPNTPRPMGYLWVHYPQLHVIFFSLSTIAFFLFFFYLQCSGTLYIKSIQSHYVDQNSTAYSKLLLLNFRLYFFTAAQIGQVAWPIWTALLARELGQSGQQYPYLQHSITQAALHNSFSTHASDKLFMGFLHHM